MHLAWRHRPSRPTSKHPETHPPRSFFSILTMKATSSQVPEGEDLLPSRPQHGRSVCPMRSTSTKQPEPLVCHKVLTLPGRGREQKVCSTQRVQGVDGGKRPESPRRLRALRRSGRDPEEARNLAPAEPHSWHRAERCSGVSGSRPVDRARWDDLTA